MIKQALDTTSELLPQDDIPQDNVLPQDDVLSILSQDNIIFQNDELPQDNTLPQDTAIENESVKRKKKELYLLLDYVKTIIDKNTQTLNAEQWIDSIDKNFNALRKMVDDCTRLERKHKIPNTWEGRNNNTFWI